MEDGFQEAVTVKFGPGVKALYDRAGRVTLQAIGSVRFKQTTRGKHTQIGERVFLIHAVQRRRMYLTEVELEQGA